IQSGSLVPRTEPPLSVACVAPRRTRGLGYLIGLLSRRFASMDRDRTELAARALRLLPTSSTALNRRVVPVRTVPFVNTHVVQWLACGAEIAFRLDLPFILLESISHQRVATTMARTSCPPIVVRCSLCCMPTAISRL